jgi:hypothetical protein
MTASAVDNTSYVARGVSGSLVGGDIADPWRRHECPPPHSYPSPRRDHRRQSGPTRLLDTIGGEVVFEIFWFVAILGALMNMFLIGWHTRADEESGRAELIRSARVSRHAPLAAALGLALIARS